MTAHRSSVLLAMLAGLVVFVRPFSGCGSSDLYYFLNYGLSLEGLLYFSAGIFVRWHPIPCPTKKVSVLLLVSGIILFGLKFVALHLGYDVVAFRLGFLAIPMAIVGVYFLLPNIRLPVFLHEISFPVYLIHVFILSAIGGRYGARGDWALFANGGGLLLWICRVFVAFVASLVIAQCMASYSPRLNTMLFGGRPVLKTVS